MESQEKSKYFTPDIEDIILGYEYEEYNKSKDEWLKRKVEDTWIGWDGEGDFPDAFSAVEHSRARVAYLTKEQIEAEGWNSTWEGYDKSFNRKIGDYFYMICRGNYNKELGVRDDSSFMEITKVKDLRTDRNTQIFAGDCKDINTFRYICKLLKIN